MLATLAATAIYISPQSVPKATYDGVASGVVYEDRNKNGVRDPLEPGIGGIRVSNQQEVVVTDRQGRWTLPSNDDVIFFVVKPKGWMTPVDKDNIPRFYYIHKPAGSPPNFKFKGVAPTGPLPKSIDFPLVRQREPNDFTALFFGDTQPRNLREVDYIARQVVEPILREKHSHKFGVTLGDVAFDDLDTLEPLAKQIGLIGIPWYYVLGNHDINFDAKHDHHSDETWERIFGPNYYSFDYGPTHFVSLDNVVWTSAENSGAVNRGGYRAGLGEKQLAWLKNDLAKVPKNQLVVLMMHIPMGQIAEKEELFRILEERPYALSVSAHTHFQEHIYFTEKDSWRGSKPHHHVVNVTTCGSWWSGAPDALGVPHSTMRDGAPAGYSIFKFNGNQYSIEYRANNRPAAYQMNIYAPDATSGSGITGTTIFANVFGGTDKSKVEFKLGNGPWRPMVQTREPDPKYVEVFERDKDLARPYRALPAPINSPHLWKANLYATSERGVVPIHVRTTDQFGQSYIATRGLRVD